MNKVTTFLAAAALLTAGVATAGLDLEGQQTDISRLAPRTMSKVSVKESLSRSLKSAQSATLSLDAPRRAAATEDGWTSIGNGTFRESIMSNVFKGVENTVFEVAIEQNDADPTTYRVVNPYANWTNPFTDLVYSDDPANYIVFHVLNDEYAYIEDFDTGLSFDDTGDGNLEHITVVSQAQALVEGNGADLVMQVAPGCLATYSDGVLKQSATFPLNGKTYSSLLLYIGEDGAYSANTTGEFAIALPGKEIVDEPEPEINWVSLGTGKLTDDFLTLFTGFSPKTFDVEIMQDADDATHYMIPNPYAGYNDSRLTLTEGKFEFYIVNDEFVYFTDMTTGVIANGEMIAPKMNMESMIQNYGAETVYAVYPDAFPKYADGAITSGITFADGDKNYYVFVLPFQGQSYAANRNGAFKIEMPEQEPQYNWVELGTGKFTDDFMASYIDGVEISTFDVAIEQDADDPNHYRIVNPYANWENATYEVEGGEAQFYVYDDSYAYFPKFNTGVKYEGRTLEVSQNVMGPINSGMTLDDIISLFPESLVKYENGLLTATTTFDNGGSPFSVFQIPAKDAQGKDILVRVNLSGAFRLEMPGYVSEPEYTWTSLGKGKYTDDILNCVFDNVTSEQLEVEVEQDANDPSHYRIVNPYAKSTQVTATDGLIEFYVVNEKYVNITKFNTGVSYNDILPVDVELFVSQFMPEYSVEEICASFPEPFPVLADGVITCSATIDGETPALQVMLPTGYQPVNTNGAFRIELPGSAQEPVNPFAPTGEEVVKGQLQTLYKASKNKLNILEGSAELGEGADGWKVQCMNETKNIEQAGSITIDGTAYATMKFSNGAQHTVTLPEGYVANAVWIYSVINKDAATDRPCYFKEIDGETYTSDRDYLVSFKDFANPDVSYFTLKGNNTFTITNSGEQALVVLVVDYSEAPKFGEGVLEAPAVWPKSGNKMLPLSGTIELTFGAEIQTKGKAMLGDTEVAMTAEGNTVKIAYSDLTPATEYTLSIPAAAIGNADAASEAITLTYTTEPANVLFYADMNQYPRGYYDLYGNLGENANIIEKGSTDVTVSLAGMTFYSGNSGRVVAMKNSDVSDDPEADYGPYTAEDAGASPRHAQLIDGGNALYVETPEFEGPAVVTFYLGNPSAAAEGTLIVTDDRADKENPLAQLAIPAAKKTFKFTVEYPYKGAAKIRLYNQKMKINVYDILVVKGEGEGIDRPEPDPDTEAPVALNIWPNEAPYAPVEGIASIIFDEPVFTTGKATLNGSELDVNTDGTLLSVAYNGLEAGKEYTLVMPAVADEAGNTTEPIEIKINTKADNVYYYTDFGKHPYSFYMDYKHIPVEGKDNQDIIAKNSTDVTAVVSGITYYSGNSGRVVAMGKPNLSYDDNGTASERCIQIIGGGGGLYLELPEAPADAELTIIVGNSKATAGTILITDARGNTEAPLATFELPAEKKAFTFTYANTGTENVAFRIYNNNTQFNLHDILVKKGLGDSGITGIEAGADSEAVYYNLQGVQVENPAPGLYIRVRGNKADKVIIR